VASLSRAAKRSGKPVLAARTGADHLAPAASAQLRSAGIPTYPTPARAVRAAAALHQISRKPAMPDARATEAGVERPTPEMNERELKVLLAHAGLPVPRGRLVRDRTDAEPAVREVGGRAVLKAVVPGLVHKSEAGGVAIGVTPETAVDTFDRLALLGGHVLAEEMVSGGVEALVGVASSPLGPVLAVGPGGVLTELLDDVALRLLPVDRSEIEDMIDQTRLAALLAGVRGAGAADRAALVEMVLGLGRAVAQWPARFELDLNPVAVLSDGRGVRILDAAYVTPEVR
jgi:acyl-CoA synthetase (NDP forming)